MDGFSRVCLESISCMQKTPVDNDTFTVAVF